MIEDEFGKYYYNDFLHLHRLNGAAIEYNNGNKEFCIDDICYMSFYIFSNKLIIYYEIIELYEKYEFDIKKNIHDIIESHIPIIQLYHFCNENIDKFPEFIIGLNHLNMRLNFNDEVLNEK